MTDLVFFIISWVFPSLVPLVVFFFPNDSRFLIFFLALACKIVNPLELLLTPLLNSPLTVSHFLTQLSIVVSHVHFNNSLLLDLNFLMLSNKPASTCMTPRVSHHNHVKRILRYLKGTLDHGLHINLSSHTILTTYSDVDRAGCLDTRRSTSGYCVFLVTI
jgi:hypothetical protein